MSNVATADFPQVNAELIPIPEPITRYEHSTDEFCIVTPCEATNFIPNPSFENDLAGYVAGPGGATFARTTEEQYSGAWSTRIDYTGPQGGIVLQGVQVAANTKYTFSVHVLAPKDMVINLSIADNGTATQIAHGGDCIVNATFWSRCSITFTTGASTSIDLFAGTDADGANNLSIYTDSWQLEPGNLTTYFDGDSFSPVANDINPPFRWLAEPHNSASTRDHATAAGGVEKSFEDFGLVLIGYQGLDMPPYEIQSNDFAKALGALYQDSIPKERQVIFQTVWQCDPTQIAQNKAAFGAAINAHRRGEIAQPVLFRYKPKRNTDCDDAIACATVDMYLVYEGGFQGNVENEHHEEYEIVFTMHDPGFTGASCGQELVPNINFTANYAFAFDRIDGWHDVNGGLTGIQAPNDGVTEIRVGPDNRAYAIGNIAFGGSNHIAVWDPVGRVWQPISTGIGTNVAGSAHDIEFGPASTVYVAGSDATDAGVFISVAGGAFALLGGAPAGRFTAGAANVPPTALGRVSNGRIYAAGSFTEIGGVNTESLGYWDGAAWNTVVPGLTRLGGAAIVDGILPIRSGFIVIGSFDSAGGIPVSNIAQYNVLTDTWIDLEGGRGVAGVDRIRAMAQFENGQVIVGGDPGLGLNVWNGRQWETPITYNGTVEDIDIRPGTNQAWVVGDFDNPSSPTQPGFVHVFIPPSTSRPVPFDLATGSDPTSISFARNGDYYIGMNTQLGVEGADLYRICNPGTLASPPVLRVRGPGIIQSLWDNETTTGINFEPYQIFDGEYVTLSLRGGRVIFESSTLGDLRSLGLFVNPADVTVLAMHPCRNFFAFKMTGENVNTEISFSWQKRYEMITQICINNCNDDCCS